MDPLRAVTALAPPPRTALSAPPRAGHGTTRARRLTPRVRTTVTCRILITRSDG
jgi:hypothetical protein